MTSLPNDKKTSAELEVLSARMREEWDRRIKHDYRFWMSESYSDDSAMFQSGERDLEILTGDIEARDALIALELGCGVGRILHAASKKFAHVHGLDVAPEGIQKAQDLLKELTNITLHLGNGLTIPVGDHSIDVVYSFASLVCMPVNVIAGYLLESQRVLKKGGRLRIQLYLGTEQPSAQTDTLSMRVFRESNFVRAVKGAGFSVERISELKIAHQVSFEEQGFKAVTVFLISQQNPMMTAAEVSQTLMPLGEVRVKGDLSDEDLEYWMLLNYAYELVSHGEHEKGKKSYQEALRIEKNVSVDAQALKDKIISLLSK